MDRRATVAGVFVLLCLIWGSTWLAIKLGVESVPTFLSVALRFLISAVVLLALAAALRRPLPRARSEWGVVAFVGLALFLGDYGLVYWGEANGVPSGLSAVLFAVMPLMTALAAHALLPRERLTVRKLLGIGVGFGGIALIFRGQLAEAGIGLLFPMLALVTGATLAGISTASMRRWAREIDGLVFNGIAMGIGALGLLAASWTLGEPWAVPSWPGGLAPILYLSLVGSVVAFVAYHWLLDHVEATTVSFILLITPIVALAIGFTAANEAIDLFDAVGTALTLGGLYVAFSRARGRAATLSARTPDTRVEPIDLDADGGK
jgi:drug/metabolite transporter (DMT)-like permease